MAADRPQHDRPDHGTSPAPSTPSSAASSAGRAALEEERDFLLTSLRDLETERDAGDLDDHDYATLHADYTRRAADVLRRLATDDPPDPDPTGTPQPENVADDGASPAPRSTASPWRRRVLAVAGVAVVAALAGVLVAQASGRRGSQGLTGLDVAEASSRLGDCQALETEVDPDAALECYDEILASLPANVGALTFRGWLQVREFDVADGIADLDAAVQVDAEATAPYLFRSIAHSRAGDPVAAIADLASFYDNDPAEQERTLAEGFTETIVDASTDACVAGDVDGSRPPVEVAECYQHILDVDPDNATATIYLGWLLGRSQVTDRALSLLDRGLSAAEDGSTTESAGLVFRAAVRGHAGDSDGARADLAAFDELHASDPRPDAQVAAATQVSQALDDGRDPLAG